MENCERLKEYDEEYIRYIIDNIEYTVPTCHPDYGWDYDDLEDVINNGLSISISLPSYKEWLRDKKINNILK